MHYTEVRKLEFLLGTELRAAVETAIGFAKDNDCNVEFVFNGTTINVSQYSDADLTMDAFRRHRDSVALEKENGQYDLECKWSQGEHNDPDVSTRNTVSCSSGVEEDAVKPYAIECKVSELAVMVAATEDKILQDWLFRYGYTLDDLINKKCFVHSWKCSQYGWTDPANHNKTYYKLLDIDYKLLSTVEIVVRVIKSECIDTGATEGFVYECREVKE
ncbi:MAG: hypothetical protein RBS96_02220 [Dehalococcoidales bacterium]|jgi:hypothetical protein|nr:hypothetical protein [Dehalococcoidales bacterium]